MVDFEQILKDNEKEVIDTLVSLIQIPSVLDEDKKTDEAPFGPNVKKALDFMMELGEKDGFEVLRDGGYAGHLSYGNPNGKLIGILCHLDVVPVGPNWKYPPFSGTIEGDKLYGRGSGDDKGPTIAAYFALKFIKDANIKLKNNIRMIFGCDEETGWRGISHYLAHYKAPDEGFVPDADFPLIYGEKGRMSFDLSSKELFKDDIVESIHGGKIYNAVIENVEAVVTKDLRNEFSYYAQMHNLKFNTCVKGNKYVLCLSGKTAHAMEPEKGINAGTYMCEFLRGYTNNPLIHYIAKYHHLDYNFNHMGLCYNDYEMGKITCNIGIIDIDQSSTRVTLDIRYPIRYDLDKFNEVFKDTITKEGLVITKSTNKHPHYVSPDDPLVTKLYDAYTKVTGDTINKPFTIGGGTYASTLKKAVAFGMKMPGEVELAHQTDEYISIENFKKTILIYVNAILSLGEVDA